MHRKGDNIAEMGKNKPVTLYPFDPFNFPTKCSDLLDIVFLELENPKILIYSYNRLNRVDLELL